MYQQHFALTRLPFEPFPAEGNVDAIQEQRAVLEAMLAALRTGEAFLKVIGDVGTGKTTLSRRLITALDADYVVLTLMTPAIPAAELMRAIADELGTAFDPGTPTRVVDREVRRTLEEIGRRGGRVALIVDEAQTLPSETLEALRLLSNLIGPAGHLVQVALFGHPSLDERIAEDGLRPLQQRIATSFRLRPLDRAACHDYVRARLLSAGSATRPVFTPAAVDRIHVESGGIPRVIDTLCHKGLEAAHADGDYQVGRRHIARALEATDGIARWRTRPLSPGRRAPRVSAGTENARVPAQLWKSSR